MVQNRGWQQRRATSEWLVQRLDCRCCTRVKTQRRLHLKDSIPDIGQGDAPIAVGVQSTESPLDPLCGQEVHQVLWHNVVPAAQHRTEWSPAGCVSGWQQHARNPGCRGQLQNSRSET